MNQINLLRGSKLTECDIQKTNSGHSLRTGLTTRALAKLWQQGGYECVVYKQDAQWILNLEKAGKVAKQSVVESLKEVIRLSEDWLRKVEKK